MLRGSQAPVAERVGWGLRAHAAKAAVVKALAVLVVCPGDSAAKETVAPDCSLGHAPPPNCVVNRPLPAPLAARMFQVGRGCCKCRLCVSTARSLSAIHCRNLCMQHLLWPGRRHATCIVCRLQHATAAGDLAATVLAD